MQIKKMTFFKNDIEVIDKNERDFLIGAAHISNEINVLSKLFQWMISKPTNEIERRVMLTQGLMLGRILNGKLYESWQYLKKAFFGAQVSKVYCPILDEEASKALNELKSYFSSENIIGTIRNKFSFHYDPIQFGAGFDALDPDVPLEIFLGEQNANTIFAFSDDIVGRGLVDSINPDDKAKAMENFMNDTSKISGLILIFLGACMRLAIGRNLLNKKKVDFDILTLHDLPRWTDIKIPFFTQSPSHFSFKLENGKTLTWGEHSVDAPKIFSH
jgi:hypothetical protein